MTNHDFMYNQMAKFLEQNPKDALAALWFTRENADWSCFTDDKFTDDEWAEIAGRFNELDWQWVSEQFQEICDDVLAERKPCIK